jgi:hypothetical protein
MKGFPDQKCKEIRVSSMQLMKLKMQYSGLFFYSREEKQFYVKAVNNKWHKEICYTLGIY